MLAELSLPLVLACGSTLVAALAAFFSYSSARATLLAYEAHIISDYSQRYASGEFLQHLRHLRDWHDTVGTEGSVFFDRLAGGDSFAARVDGSRRAVKMHYEGAARLGRAKYLRRLAVREICSSAGLDLYFDVAIPLTLQINPKMDLKLYRYLQSLKMPRQSAMKSFARDPASLPAET